MRKKFIISNKKAAERGTCDKAGAPSFCLYGCENVKCSEKSNMEVAAMTNFIEELYYGNIEPQNMKKKESKSYSREMKILSENEDILLEKLPEEDKKLFLEYVDAWGIVDGESVVDSFITGFRLGARFIYDMFVSVESDILKEG